MVGCSAMAFEVDIPTVANLPLEQPLFCTPDDSIQHVAKLMSNRRKYCVLVKNGDILEGVVTTKDLAFREGFTAKDVLSSTPVLTPSSMPVTAALQTMVEKKIRHLPIVDPVSNQITGILDITKCFHQAMRRLEIMAQDSQKLNNAIQDVIENEATMARKNLLQDIADLIESMEAPVLQTILDSDVYNTAPVFASPSTTVSKAIQLMAENNSTAVLVHDSSMKKNTKNSCDCNIIGIFTSKDFVCRVLNQDAKVDPSSCTLTRVMTTRPNFAFKTLGIHSALRMMYEGHFLNLPIIDDTGNILGLISVLQLTHAALSCQFAARSKTASNCVSVLDEPYLKISSTTSSTESVEASERNTYDSNRVQASIENDFPSLSMNYFWKSFDASDNESASSSQLSLIDLSQTVGNYNENKPLQLQQPQEQFSGRRSSTLLQKKFFGKGKHRYSAYRLRIIVIQHLKNETESHLGSIKMKVPTSGKEDGDLVNEIMSRVKGKFQVLDDAASYNIKWLDLDIFTSDDLRQFYDEFVLTHGSRNYMPLQLSIKESRSRLTSSIRQIFSRLAAPVLSILQVPPFKIYMQACVFFLTGIIVGRAIK